MEFRTNENTAKSLTNLWSTRIFGFYHSTFLCVFWLTKGTLAGQESMDRSTRMHQVTWGSSQLGQ